MSTSSHLVVQRVRQKLSLLPFTWVNLLCELFSYLFCEGQQCCAPNNSQCQVIKRGIFQKDYCSKLLRSIFGGEKMFANVATETQPKSLLPSPISLPACLPILWSSLTHLAERSKAIPCSNLPLRRNLFMRIMQSSLQKKSIYIHIINTLFLLFQFNSYLQSITYRCSSIDFSNVASKGSGCTLSCNDNSVASN